MSFNGITNLNQYKQTTGYYNNTVDKKEKQQANRSEEAEKTQAAGHVGKSKEQALSGQAQDVLKQLKAKYGNMDFMVADFNNADEAKAILSKGRKDFSVLFSSEELEKMASDENYLKEKMGEMEKAVQMSDEINQKLGFDKDGKPLAAITKMGISFNDDGTTSFFVELEKASEKQKKHIEKALEEKDAAKKLEKKESEKELHSYTKGGADTKRTFIQADSMEELLEKIGAVDWDKVKGEQAPENGRRFDYNI